MERHLLDQNAIMFPACNELTPATRLADTDVNNIASLYQSQPVVKPNLEEWLKEETRGVFDYDKILIDVHKPPQMLAYTIYSDEPESGGRFAGFTSFQEFDFAVLTRLPNCFSR